MWFVLSAAALALSSVAFAWAYPRQVSSLCRLDAAELRGASHAERIEALRGDGAPGSWPRSLAEIVTSTSEPRLRLAALNDHLADAEYELSRRARWPLSATQLCVATAVLSAIGGYLAGARLELVWIVAVLLAGTLTCVAAQRRGRRAARAQRENIDRIVSMLAHDLDNVDLPSRRKRR